MTRKQGYVLYVAAIVFGALPCILTAAQEDAASKRPKPADSQKTAASSVTVQADKRIWTDNQGRQIKAELVIS